MGEVLSASSDVLTIVDFWIREAFRNHLIQFF